MKPFKFTLQAVRTLRQRQEQKARERYARALLTQREAQTRLKQVEAELEQAWSQITHQLPGGLPAANLSQLHAYAQSVEERRREHAAILAALSQALQKTAEEWRAARRESEVVEKCRLTQVAAYQRRVLAEEQKVLDELGNRDRPSLSCPAFGAVAEPNWN